MVSSLLELNEDDLSEINQMVDDWEFNFGSLEVNLVYKLPSTFSNSLPSDVGRRRAAEVDRQHAPGLPAVH